MLNNAGKNYEQKSKILVKQKSHNSNFQSMFGMSIDYIWIQTIK